VVDAETSTPLEGAVVIASQGTTPVANALTDGRGRFQLRLATGSYDLEVIRIGYATQRLDGVSAGGGPYEVRMQSAALQLAPLVVTANLTLETMLASPSAITVVPRANVTRRFATTTLDLLRDVPGVDFANKGLFDNTFMTRGPRPMTAQGVLVMSDYRYASLPVLGFINSGLIPATQEDIERVEVVRGPGAVVYGPNSRRGVVHMITRSPLGPSETTFSLAGGQQQFFDGSFRLSRRIGEDVGFKLSGRYAGGDEWSFVDPIEVMNRENAIAAGADPETLLIGDRRERAEVFQSGARLDWRTGDAVVVSDVGFSRGTGISTGDEAGAAQSVGWLYAYGQVRLEHPSYFANLVYNWSDSGDETYNLRSGDLLTDNSRLFAAQFQHKATLGPSRLLSGADFQLGDPRSNGTIYGRFEDDDALRESGVYVHSSTALSPRVELIGALRLDHHNRLDDAWFLSPRAALVVKPGADHSLRASWSRSFAQPSTRDLFPDLNLGPLGPLPYSLRLTGSGGQGFTFDRSCGGLCMRVPAALAGGQLATLPADATLMWPALVALLQAQGIDLSAIPAPSASDVGTILAALSPATQEFVPVAPGDVRDVPAVQRTVETTFEVGYKGHPVPELFTALDVYVTRVSEVFSTQASVSTPNVFLDPATLGAYLGQFLPPEALGAVVAGLASVPVGTISPNEVDGADLLIFAPAEQGGEYDYWGFDVSATWQASEPLAVHASYSFTSTDSTSLGDVPGFLMFHAPQHRGNVALEYTDDELGRSGYVRARANDGFSVRSPAYVGEVPGFGLLDVGGGVRLPWDQETWLRLDALNVLGNDHREFLGVPEIGRMVTARVTVRW
jgi:iron complex outermembrane receptor protein